MFEFSFFFFFNRDEKAVYNGRPFFNMVLILFQLCFHPFLQFRFLENMSFYLSVFFIKNKKYIFLY